jgi:uncharacterized protein YndB with AHSA1/START domain
MNRDLKANADITINASPDLVWDALVNPEKIKVYLFGTNTSSQWTLGSEIVFEGEYQGQHYRDKGKITDIQANKILQYTYWTGFSGLEDKEENYSLVRFELKKDGSTTQLLLTQAGFPSEQAAEHSSLAWKQILEAIKKLVEATRE